MGRDSLGRAASRILQECSRCSLHSYILILTYCGERLAVVVKPCIPLGALAGLAAALLLAGCASAPPLTESDTRVISQLASIAPAGAEIDGAATEVECWQPSEAMLDDQTFRVLCRVHYLEGADTRYRDVICIGDIAADPVSEYCYRWAYYTDMPEFEDKPGHVVV